MGEVIMFPNSKPYVSPFLLKPLRSYEEAYRDINEMMILRLIAASHE